MARNTFTRRSLAAVALAPAVIPSALVATSNVDRLAALLAQRMANGMLGFHLSPGPAFHGLDAEQRAGVIIQALEATETATPMPLIGDSRRGNVNVREFVAGLA